MVQKEQAPGSKVDRRTLLRGGAAAATVAGLGVAGVVNAPDAAAAPVSYVQLGTGNAETTSTAITVNGTTGDTAVPALTLTNANGPSLALNTLPADWKGTLQPGQLAATTDGLLLGITDNTVPLVSALDLASLPVTVPVPAVRLLDLRSAAGRERITGSSPNAFDPAGRLKAGASVDVAVGKAGNAFIPDGLFANVTVAGGAAPGYLTVYAPEERPGSSSLNWAANQIIANMVFVGVTLSDDMYIVRIYTSATVFVILDVTGLVFHFDPEAANVAAIAGHRTAVRPASLAAARQLLESGAR